MKQLSWAVCAMALSWSQPVSAETRHYVIEWFAGASFNEPDDCVSGINPNVEFQYQHALSLIGYSKEEIEKLQQGGEGGGNLGSILANRGRIDGKPVNAYTNPSAVADSKHSYIGGKGSKYSLGFNLDSQGADDPASLEDPVTHERGIDNEVFRALGCYEPFRGSLATRPSQWDYTWSGLRSGMQAWLVSISGDDLMKDGDATVTIQKAQEHVTIDAQGKVQNDMTFRINPDARSRNVYPAKLKNGVVEITKHDNFTIVSGEIFMFPVLSLSNTHLRLTMKPDGTLTGLIGGYQRWVDFYEMSAAGAYPFESSLGIDGPGGMYPLLRRLADANPDPKTGNNRDISVAYRLDAVPAFVIPAADAQADQKNR